MQNYESANQCTWSSCSLSSFSISWYGVSKKATKKAAESRCHPPARRSCVIAPSLCSWRATRGPRNYYNASSHDGQAKPTVSVGSSSPSPFPPIPTSYLIKYRPGSPKENCQQRAADRWRPLQLSPRAEIARARLRHRPAYTSVPARWQHGICVGKKEHHHDGGFLLGRCWFDQSPSD